ncbi:hypothetical protein [Hyphomonas sp.]|uniref:hypothetical protein n=1 Tax=Hyphomonas sp. TaxID=87 RepID=UPI000DFB3D45|nr:hypothetical protein [Hyphomonas sp.]RCL88716.1 MAG: hypothetical protein DBW63_03725 [Hyphomonas sp.]
MILRRVIAHFRKQEWTAIALDFLIVVIGVFVGLQVSNWNETANDRRQEQAVLQAMLEDIAATSRGMQEFLDINIAGSESLKALAEHIDDRTNPPPLAEIDTHVFRGIYQYPSLNLSMATYEELKNTGKLDLVLDQDLRKRLQLLEGAIGVVRSDTDQLESLTLNTTDKYLLENYDFRGLVSLRIGETPAYVDWVDPEENRIDISGIFDDPYFMNLVLLRARLNSAYQRDTNRLLVELADIEALIKSKLKPEGRQQ